MVLNAKWKRSHYIRYVDALQRIMFNLFKKVFSETKTVSFIDPLNCITIKANII